MVAQLVVTAVLAASQPPFSIAIPGLNAVRLAEGEGELYANLLSQKLYERGAKVISPRDMGAVLGLERQKQLLDPAGCNESCTAELAAALGVDTLLVGDIGKPGTKYTVTLKILSSKDAAVLAVYSGTDISVDDMPKALDRAAYELLKQVSVIRADVSPGPDPSKVEVAATATARSGGPPKRWALAPAIVGVAALVAGGVCLGLARGQLSVLHAATTEPEARSARDSGSLLQTAGFVGLGIGVAAVLAAGAVFLFGADAPVNPTVAWGPGGAIGAGLAWSVP